MTTMSINYFDQSPWWQGKANKWKLNRCNCTQHEGETWNIKWINLHHDGVFRITVSFTNAAALNVEAKLVISMNCYDGDAWRTTKRCTEATTPEARPKLSKKDRNRTWCECKNIDERQDWTSVLLTKIRPRVNYHVRQEGELKLILIAGPTTGTTLLLGMRRATNCNVRWRNSDCSSRATYAEYWMQWAPG